MRGGRRRLSRVPESLLHRCAHHSVQPPAVDDRETTGGASQRPFGSSPSRSRMRSASVCPSSAVPSDYRTGRASTARVARKSRHNNAIAGAGLMPHRVPSPESAAAARLRLQSWVAHAAADGHRYAVEPPRPRGSHFLAPWSVSWPASAAFDALVGPRSPDPPNLSHGDPTTAQPDPLILELRTTPAATGC